ncbi:hypothetical protein DB30_04718 [Enhygromyxa salina]|uniref:Uncharacterized protein n=1 Tax=Enhygromyxa salina TaxID=215803 RepID=A0A0C1ZYH1_9BACT|nr:hypothetical protein [Enhygromyxa salina]KIG16258.1 hypothetical protein DB30_04718 [Enhygromyxa salina]
MLTPVLTPVLTPELGAGAETAPVHLEHEHGVAAARARCDLAELQTSADAARGLPSYGHDWESGIELGVDVMMLVRNLTLPPHERLRQADQHQRFIDAVQRTTVCVQLREQLERERLWEKIDALGGPDPAWPEALRERR